MSENCTIPKCILTYEKGKGTNFEKPVVLKSGMIDNVQNISMNIASHH
jgi:hypothetical protein